MSLDLDLSNPLSFLYLLVYASLAFNVMGVSTSVWLSWEAWSDVKLISDMKLEASRLLVAERDLRMETAILVVQLIIIVSSVAGMTVSSDYYEPMLHDLIFLVAVTSLLRTIMSLILFLVAIDSFLVRRALLKDIGVR